VISSTGTVTCQSVYTGDITAVNAGTGLTGGGSSGSVTLNADTTYLQRRVSATCAAGSSIRAISSTGSVTCETDDTGAGGGRIFGWSTTSGASFSQNFSTEGSVITIDIIYSTSVMWHYRCQKRAGNSVMCWEQETGAVAYHAFGSTPWTAFTQTGHAIDITYVSGTMSAAYRKTNTNFTTYQLWGGV
jgi:hypothetical protein